MALSGVSSGAIKSTAEQLIQDISRIRWRGQPLGACCSLGVCRTSRPGVTYEALYGEADRALYQAKAEGKGRCLLRELE